MPTNLDVEIGLVVATVPLAAYPTAGEYPVVLRDDATRRVRAPVRFVVRGGS